MTPAADDRLGESLTALVERFGGSNSVDYRQLAEALRQEIAAERIGIGTQLPPQRDLARLLSVGRTTVAGAYNLLLGESLIRMVQGAGTWVVARPDEQRCRPALQGAETRRPS
jgi:DNA-binding GntR family transcriptional regulator